jgi:hypothetical protein
MAKQALEYKLAELKPEDFIYIPSLNIAIAKAKARAASGGVLANISWYDTKLLTQSLGSNYFLPTSAQWSKSRRYLQQHYPELEKDFISGEYEWVDSLLAFPNEKREYSPRLQISDVKKGETPLLIEQSRVEKDGNDYILTEGKVIEVSELPLKSGYIQAWNEDLGLPTKVGKNPNKKFKEAYFWVNTKYSYHEGLRALLRGPWTLCGHEGRFDVHANWDPSASNWGVGFRLGRAASADESSVRMSRTEYERLLELSKELNELLSRVRV